MMNEEHLPDTVNYMQIPAGVDLSLRIMCLGRDSKKFRSWCPVWTENINITQGRMIDLGVIEIGTEMPIYVEEVDSSGRLLENIPVAHGEVDTLRSFELSVTNERGLGEFHTRPYYKAKFFVVWYDDSGQQRRHEIVYETRGPQDRDNLYRLQLPDEVVEYFANR